MSMHRFSHLLLRPMSTFSFVALAAAFLTCAPSKQSFAQSAAWHQLQPLGPGGPSFVYDLARHNFILATGTESWTWDSADWQQRIVASPPATFGQQMVFDTLHNKAILYTGAATNSIWEWNGVNWTQRLPSGPVARANHAMAYDSLRGVVVMFGGDFAGVPDLSTWEWNGSTWTQRVIPGPSRRYSHSMTFDPVRGVTVLYGGNISTGGQTEVDQTWEYNGTAWSQRLVTGPSYRSGAAMTFDADRGVTLLYGGRTILDTHTGQIQIHGDTWTWNGSTWTLVSSTGPGLLTSAALTFDPVHHVSVLFGGSHPNTDDGALADASAAVWEWNGSQWNQRTGGAPLKRYDSAAAYDSTRKVTVLFGGRGGSPGGGSNPVHDTWERSGSVWNYKPPMWAPPSERAGHALAFDAARNNTIMFGGKGGTSQAPEYKNDTWDWNGVIWTQHVVPGPSPREKHAMCFDAVRNVIVLFGGLTSTVSSDETWEWDGTAWTQRFIVGPSARYGAAMEFDADRGVSVLFSGLTASGASAETWEFDGAAWTNRAVSGPSARYYHKMAYNADRHRMVISTGFIPLNSSTNQTWEWDGIAWTQQVLSPAPAARQGSVLIYDQSERSLVLFGGTDVSNNIKGDTWGLAASCAADFNADFTVDFFDYLDFVDAFSRGAASSDFNNDAVVDFFDYLDFVDAFATGC